MWHVVAFDLDVTVEPQAQEKLFTLPLFPEKVHISDYTYQLPQDKIAFYPLPQRDASKLLVCRQGTITHTLFRSLSDQLPANAFLFFNDTRVIPARLHFRKETGAVIEIFLLNPVAPSSLIAETMAATKRCSWQCTIGNLKKWPDGVTLEKQANGLILKASILDRTQSIIQFTWQSEQSFAEIIRRMGETPLPPYIKRGAEQQDAERYQTVYSHYDGAVAAPTAGLHFTPAVFESLRQKNIGHDFLTLHVSAGTFQPIKTQNAAEHVMHEEQIIFRRRNLENLLVPDRIITAVGTTSMRTLESLYWFGVKLIADPNAAFKISQDDPYTPGSRPSTREALEAVARYMDHHGVDEVIGETSIYIRPGYSFRVCKALITNFHQPGSTLILLVAAFIGEKWKEIYREALDNNYRFLSYGDSSLLIP